MFDQTPLSRIPILHWRYPINKFPGPNLLQYVGIQKIEYDAFSGCSLERISIPFTVTEISHDVFYKCSSLKEVVLNKGLEKIGKGAFDSCTSLVLESIHGTRSYQKQVRLSCRIHIIS